MKVIILAGGLGTRISEETDTKPKPMVLLDDKPIIWHLMNTFATQGYVDFVIATGYLGNVIQEWVATLDTSWSVKAIDTGKDTMTSGRIRRCMEYIGDEKVFVTYGDGLGNINLRSLVKYHETQGRLATVTAVRPPARFGHLHIEGSQVTHFGEKTQSDAGWINGGYFVLEPEVADFVLHDDEPFETGALPRLVEKSQLMAFHHYDFWQPMDTLRERNELSVMAKESPPPWLRIDNTPRK
jgi:glucose-1-phosphate cytidylyltransferase